MYVSFPCNLMHFLFMNLKLEKDTIKKDNNSYRTYPLPMWYKVYSALKDFEYLGSKL